MERKEILEVLRKLRPNATFLVVHKYRNEFNELSNFQIQFHVYYQGVVQKSLNKLKDYVPIDAIEDIAKREMMVSFRDSLTRMDQGDFQRIEEIYQYFWDKDKIIKGVRMHHDSGEIHINGYLVNKVILEPGKYPKHDPSAKTKAKEKLSRLLPIDKYRQFKLSPKRFERIEVQHQTILPP